jgi:hypothetical protein
MKNRKRESCTSGTVRDEDGNILIYSARPASTTGVGTRTEARAGDPKTSKGDAMGRAAARIFESIDADLNRWSIPCRS